MSRLSSISETLDKQMENATAAQRLDAIKSVCNEAAAEIENLSSLLREALPAPAPDALLQTKLEQLRDRLDDQYFDAQEKAEDDGSTSDLALRFFSEARLAAAMALAMLPLDAPTACEALYEALMALSDHGPAVRRLELILT